MQWTVIIKHASQLHQGSLGVQHCRTVVARPYFCKEVCERGEPGLPVMCCCVRARTGVHVGKVLLEVGGSQERLAKTGVHPAVRGPPSAAPGQAEAAPADAEVVDTPIQVSGHASARPLPHAHRGSPAHLCARLHATEEPVEQASWKDDRACG